jgi:hypothetical protein
MLIFLWSLFSNLSYIFQVFVHLELGKKAMQQSFWKTYGAIVLWYTIRFLQDNSLSGMIPNWLADLPSLSKLWVLPFIFQNVFLAYMSIFHID